MCVFSLFLTYNCSRTVYTRVPRTVLLNFVTCNYSRYVYMFTCEDLQCNLHLFPPILDTLEVLAQLAKAQLEIWKDGDVLTTVGSLDVRALYPALDLEETGARMSTNPREDQDRKIATGLEETTPSVSEVVDNNGICMH